MNLNTLPRWSLWAIGTVVVWTVWGLFVGRPMMHKTAEYRRDVQKTESERTALDTRMAAVPNLVHRLNEAQSKLDSTLSTFSTDDAIDDLIGQMRLIGGRHGLGDVRVDPELISLLHVPMAASTPGNANGRLDTVVVNLSARGAFKSLGHWLDDIEQRSDFRYWTMCHWASNADDGIVSLEAQAALVVVNRPDPETALAKVESSP